MKKIIIALLGCSIIFAAVIHGFEAHSDQLQKQVRVTFTLDKNIPDLLKAGNDYFLAHLTIENLTDHPLNNWQLCFNSSHPILELYGVSLKGEDKASSVYPVGGYYVVHGNAALQNDVIPAQGKIQFNLKGRNLIKHFTDTPTGYFLYADKGSNYHALFTVAEAVDLNILTSDYQSDEFYLNERNSSTAVENNLIGDAVGRENSLVTPMPVSLVRPHDPDLKFVLNKESKIYFKGENDVSAAQFLLSKLRPVSGYSLPVFIADQPRENAIIFSKVNRLPKVPADVEGAYRLKIDANNILIEAEDDEGFFYAVQTLLQLFPPQIFGSTAGSEVIWQVPALEINDFPRFQYRGMHLDVARHFISIADIKHFLDLMAMVKLNVFHWHLTDDEGWRIEIKRYPELTKIGAWQGANETLVPQHGLGAERNGGYYTQEEISEIIKYAKARHITVIPEIDMPGHARAMIKSLPNELIDSTDASKYTSIQGYHDNVLSPCMESTYQVIDNIVSELAQLFPGEYIHIGFDEIPTGAWENSTSCKALAAHEHFQNSAQDLKAYFIKRVAAIIEKHDKKMAGWQEVALTDDHPEAGVSDSDAPKENIRAYVWHNVNDSAEILAKGYRVVLMPAENFYFDLVASDDPEEPGFYWAGTVDIFRTYSFTFLNYNFENKYKNNIEGIEGALWGENLATDWSRGESIPYFKNFSIKEQIDYLAMPRMAALAEVAWTPREKRNFNNFVNRLGAHFLSCLDYAGINYRIPPPGLKVYNNFTTPPAAEANVAYPGLKIRYSLNGQEPNNSSPLYQPGQKITIPDNEILQMATFNSLGEKSRVVELYGHEAYSY